jgi:hypothetical protein
MSVEKIIATIPGKSPAERSVMRRNAERLVETGTPDQKAQAGQLLQALEAQSRAERDALAADLSTMTASERVARAFEEISPNPVEQMLIQSLLDNPGALTLDLSHLCGWEGGWQGQFGKMCRRRQALLGPVPDQYANGEDFYSSLLAQVEKLGNGENNWRYTMKPEAAAAFARLGFRAKV